MAIFIKHIEGSKSDQIESFEGDQIRIGRHSDNDLKFDPRVDVSVSGFHAEIYRDGERFFIKDLQSRNGTLVNSRKIDQPIAVKDGDIIQFSARGPKVIFSTRDPTATPEAAAVANPESAPTEFFSAEAVRAEASVAPTRFAFWDHLRAYLPYYSVSAAVVALSAVGLLFLRLPWWTLLIGAAVILFIAGAAYLGWRWWRRRKSAAQQRDAAHQEREISLGRGDQDNLQDLKKKWSEVLRSLKDSKLQRASDDPIYAFPWFLVMGEPGSGKSSLVRAGGPLSSVLTPGGEGPTRNCDWWFFDKSVLLDTSGRYVFQSKESDAAGEWQAILSQLKTNRRKEPVNGVVVTLPADALVARPFDKLKEQAAQLRERLDEMTQLLGIKFPVYLTITKSDLLPGFHEIFQGLPEQAKGQALGYANTDALTSSDAARFFDRAFRAICARAEQLRLAVLNDAESVEAARSVFLFPPELKSLLAPLKAFVEVLFRPSPYRDAPFFRGLFFASSRQSGTPLSRLSRLLNAGYSPGAPKSPSRDLFLRDFFSTILPNDRGLVGGTAHSREGSQLRHAAGLVAAAVGALVVCGLLTLSFTNNWRALARHDGVSPCRRIGAAAGNLIQILRPLDECRETIEDLTPHSLWKRIFFDFGLGYAREVGRVLQERYARDFDASVVSVIDKRTDQSTMAHSCPVSERALDASACEFGLLGHFALPGW